MLYAVLLEDDTDLAADIRGRHMPAHLTFLEANAARIKAAGPLRAPSGEPVWTDMARRSALALVRMAARGLTLSSILTQKAVENAMLLHAACGGSTNLLLHIPAIAHAAGLPRPTIDDWNRINRTTPRLVDALPNGPRNHPTVQVFLAGGVPEVMLHLRDLGLLNLDVLTVTGEKLGAVLDWWKESDRRPVTVDGPSQTGQPFGWDDKDCDDECCDSCGFGHAAVFFPHAE